MTRRITARNCNYFIKSCRIIDLSNFINIYGKKEKVSELKKISKRRHSFNGKEVYIEMKMDNENRLAKNEENKEKIVLYLYSVF